jgi:cytidylate kinase
MANTRLNVAFAGLTAAGKTTHARLVAAQLGYEYISATDLMLRLVGLDSVPSAGVWFTHFEQLERARADDRIDDELERQLTDLASTRQGIVFDTWALPWISDVEMVRVWIESDHRSRSWKCFVSQGAEPRLDVAACSRLVEAKDRTTRRRFLRRHDFDLFTDRRLFDAVLDNTRLITAPTWSAAQAGINRFAPYVSAAVLVRLSHDRTALGGLRSGDPGEYARIVRRARGEPGAR